MQELINQAVTDAVLARAKELLSNGTVNRVIGWEKGLFEDDQTPRVFTSVEELDKDFNESKAKSDVYLTQKEILSILSDSNSQEFEYEMIERVKNPFYKNLDLDE